MYTVSLMISKFRLMSSVLSRKTFWVLGSLKTDPLMPYVFFESEKNLNTSIVI